MTMEAIRDFDSGSDYKKWKMGEKHTMFVRFVHHSRKVLAGQSDLITLDLSEKVSQATGDQMDSETDVFPG